MLQDIRGLTLLALSSCLISAIFAGFFGKWLGRRFTHWLSNIGVAISFFASLTLLKILSQNNTSVINFTLYHWATIADKTFQIGFLIDQLTVLMMCVVTFVSWMVHLYTIGYMRHDKGYQRFFCYIALFTFMMLVLVMSNNLLQLFFGWEGVGLVSYLLIGFWHHKESAVFANLKAFLINRVGDVGFLLGIGTCFYCFGTVDYAVLLQGTAGALPTTAINIWGYSLNPYSVICSCLFIGAMGKSAQMPLHVWLPDSMEGPTPISALIHAATMVTAGIFMVTRFAPFFEHTPCTLNMILIIGSSTCFLMGLMGIVQNDIKRIIAYSTLSQLGIMVAALGVSHYHLSIFHLTTHAFFKALLFLGAGSVILALHHEQNIWKMGALRARMPITYTTMLLGSLSLCGVPFFSGFYSKDLIIEAVRASSLQAAPFAYWALIAGVFITAFYTFRLLFVVFHGNDVNTLVDKHAHPAAHHVHESPAIIWVPLVLLSIPTVMSGGVLFQPFYNGFLQSKNTVIPSPPSLSLLNFSTSAMMELPFLLIIIAIITAWLLYIKRPNFIKKNRRWFIVPSFILEHKYGFDFFYETIVTSVARFFGVNFWRFIDLGLIDNLVNGIARAVVRLALVVRRLQTGYIYHYAFTMILGCLLIAIWFFKKPCL